MHFLCSILPIFLGFTCARAAGFDVHKDLPFSIRQAEVDFRGVNKSAILSVDFVCRSHVNVLWTVNTRPSEGAPAAVPISGAGDFRVWTRRLQSDTDGLCTTTLYIPHVIVDSPKWNDYVIEVQMSSFTDEAIQTHRAGMVLRLNSDWSEIVPKIVYTPPEFLTHPGSSVTFTPLRPLTLLWQFLTTEQPIVVVSREKYYKDNIFHIIAAEQVLATNSPDLTHYDPVRHLNVKIDLRPSHVGGYNVTVNLTIPSPTRDDAGIYFLYLRGQFYNEGGLMSLSTELVAQGQRTPFPENQVAPWFRACSKTMHLNKDHYVIGLHPNSPNCIKCLGYGDGFKGVKLYKDNRDLTDSFNHSTFFFEEHPGSQTVVYTIRSPSRSDEGNYTCAVWSRNGGMVNQTVNVKLLGKLQITAKLVKWTPRKVVVECLGTGTPLPELIFTRQLPGQPYDDRKAIKPHPQSGFRVRKVYDDPNNPHVIRATLIVLLPFDEISRDIYECTLNNGFDVAVDYVNLSLYEPAKKKSKLPPHSTHRDYLNRQKQKVTQTHTPGKWEKKRN